MKNASTKKPLGKGQVAKVPMVMQMEALECGAASLDMILGYYGRFVPLSQLRKDCGVSRDGSTMKNIYLAAESYGLEVHAFRYNVDELKTETSYPCILYWEYNHFIVLDGYRRGKFIVNDPAKGIVLIPEEDFARSYSGMCMIFSPTESFIVEGKPESVLDFAVQRLKGTGGMIALILITTTILTLIGVLEPIFPRLYVDYILTGRAISGMVRLFFIGFFIIALVKIIVSWIKNAYLIKMEGKMAVYASTQFIWHILRLPMDFFSQRLPGDIMQRNKSNATITSTLLLKFTPLILDFMAMIFYLALMIQYSLPLTAISVVSVGLNLTVSIIISRKQVNLSRVQMKNHSLLANTGMSGMSMIETIKSSGAEDGFFEKWAGIQAACNEDKVKMQDVETLYGQIPPLISDITSNIILCIGVGFIIKGNWTMGLISAFSGYLTAFTNPATELIKATQSFQEMRTNMERIEDVMKYPTDVKAVMDLRDDNYVYQKLSGAVEFKNVTFGYNRLMEPLISDFSMTVKKGQSVAFVGGSGCGKSTLAKLATGLNQPWSGEILFDGKSIHEIKRSVFTASVSSVDQDISLFADTITNNISMWDSSISEDSIIKAAEDAQIYNDIMVRENGFAFRLLEGGSNFSGGQRQRIEIARALASDPTLIVMDEATSALDAETEYSVIKSIRERGITTIMISHRLSTIRDCDEIIVLKDGAVIDRGCHEELMQRCEYYVGMITSE